MDRDLEEARIRRVYAQRDRSGKRSLYGTSRPENAFWRARRERLAREMLSGLDLSAVRGLDVGCGAGDWLRTLLEWGAAAELLHGIDLLPDRIEEARALSPTVDFVVGSGFRLPHESASIDLVCANTVFSSIPSSEARNELAGEILRVLAPDGLLLVYDFRISHPRNPDTVGVGRREIGRLFPGRPIQTRSLSLAPPIARGLCRVSVTLAGLIEAGAPFLRTHALHRVGSARSGSP